MTSASQLIGRTLKDTYRIVGLIAEGGMGAVYEAEHLRLHRRVAIKLVSRRFSADADALARFRREAEIVARVEHPHVVQISDVDETEAGEPYLVMELLQGETLGDRLDRERLTVGETLRITSQVASALAATHAHGIVHRDLKPANVFLVRVAGEPDCVKVLDFGASKAREGSFPTVDARRPQGTPGYIAPEQVRGLADADHRADQYSLAAMAHEMLSGHQPLCEDDDPDRVTTAPALAEAASEVPAALAAVIHRAMSTVPDDRYASVAQFAEALASAASPGDAPFYSPVHSAIETPGRYHARTPQEPPPSDFAQSPALARPVAAAAEPRVAPARAAEQLILRARAALDAGRLDQAVALAEETLELAVSGGDEHVFRVLGPAVPLLDAIFSARVGLSTTRLLRGHLDEEHLHLSVHAARMASRAEAGATVREIVETANMPRRDATRVLAGLLRRGVLVAGPGASG